MEIVYALVALSLAVLAFGLSVVSLGLHWVKRNETVEYSELSKRIVQLDLALLDSVDKFKHFAARQTQRTAREGADKKREEEQLELPLVNKKAELRRRARAAHQAQVDGA